MPSLSSPWRRWVYGRPFHFLGRPRRLVGLAAMIAVVHAGAMTALAAAAGPRFAALLWRLHPWLTFLLVVPLAVVCWRSFRALAESGFLDELAATPMDRAEIPVAFLRRFTLPGWAATVGLVLEALAASWADGALPAEAAQRVGADLAVGALVATALLVPLAFHAAVALARTYDFAGESLRLVFTHLGRLHRYVLLPLVLLGVPLLGLAFAGTLTILALVAALAVMLSLLSGDGAWGWMPAVRDHVLFEPLREDEF